MHPIFLHSLLVVKAAAQRDVTTLRVYGINKYGPAAGPIDSRCFSIFETKKRSLETTPARFDLRTHASRRLPNSPSHAPPLVIRAPCLSPAPVDGKQKALQSCSAVALSGRALGVIIAVSITVTSWRGHKELLW